MYYAIEHTYGRGTVNDGGRDIGHVHRFDTAAERDAWCEDGPGYTNAPKYREPVRASHPFVRRILREQRRARHNSRAPDLDFVDEGDREADHEWGYA